MRQTLLGPETARLEGRVALVTGAAAGIGRATALAMARFGADVAVCDRDGERLAGVQVEIEAMGRHALTGVFDVRDGEAVARWLDQVGSGFGSIDVLVNNAGGTFNAAFLDVTARGQEALVHENFTSVTHFVRGVVPFMPAEGGSIVNVTSVEAHRGAPGYAVYAAMKAAVENLTRSLALELGERNIRVNCVAPDAIATEGERLLGAQSRREDGYPTPIGRDGTPEDCAAAIVFLASPMASFVTGTTLHVDGGTDAARGWKRGRDGTWRP